MADPQRILLVEDDEPTAELLKVHLETQGYRVTSARDGAQALELMERDLPDLVLLDLMLPRVDGITVCRRVREYSTVPIIVLSAIGMEDKKIEALDLGANDYVTKPFGVRELTARVRAALRQVPSQARAERAAHLRAGNLEVDLAQRLVRIGRRQVRLTPIEFRLLCELARHPEEVLSHRHLLSRVWGEPYGDSTNYLHIYIGRLRQRLSGLRGAQIVTHAGVGYALSTSLRPSPSRKRRRLPVQDF